MNQKTPMLLPLESLAVKSEESPNQERSFWRQEEMEKWGEGQEKTRLCKKCRVLQPIENFYKRSDHKGGRTALCSECIKLWARLYRKNNPDHVRLLQKANSIKHREAIIKRAKNWYIKNREYALAQMAWKRKHDISSIIGSKLKADFGINFEQYQDILESQKGECAICKKTPEENKKRLAVDHCHNSKKVRGLLCSTCNQGLGLFKDSPQLLTAAIKYLTQKTP